ncbi:probable galacturonosyltransferase 7 isoform X2 [Syzygium oleosum]|uniref:probable galacturonosyltransferase 7 isoform X2 n=1 Tax=Syzygium oleosum TaxID=219896 RepID=UPI0024BB37BB|nr:probable galacturonosyltransferase 7 isoform X2 [Syzygium oleosum]
MKGGGGGGGGSGVGKRRWRGLVIGVLGLVVLSMLVPLGFLLGRFHSASTSVFVSDQLNAGSSGIRSYDKYDVQSRNWSKSEKDHSKHVEDLIKKLGPAISKDILKNVESGTKNHSVSSVNKHDSHQGKVAGFAAPAKVVFQPVPSSNVTEAQKVEGFEPNKVAVVDVGKSCELRFGSYCLWLQEHREDMKDSMVKRLKDQLFVARAYFPSIAKLPTQEKLSRELRQNIQDFERVLSESSKDADLPPQIRKKLQKMKASIANAKSFPVDCNNVYKKLSQILDLTEDEANFHMKQSAFLYRVAVQTMPKSLHCLSMRLTVDYFTSHSNDMEVPLSEKYLDPTLRHLVIFSKNVLASSVVINSTVMHAKESQNLVFHVLTDQENYFAMKLWYFKNAYKDATVQVLNVEDLDLDYHDKAALLPLSLSEEFRVSFHGMNNMSILKTRTEYISIFSNSHYLLPEVFPSLKKIVVLDDDVVVQQDLSALWGLIMGGKVNGAVQFCSVRLGQLQSYLGVNSLDKNSCAWMSGLNLIDLARWRELKLTETYRRLVQELDIGEQSIEAAALRASLLTFQDLILALDGEWVLSGLGHQYGLDSQAIRKAAVLHYNGNMKPWLEMGIPKYKGYWRKFLNLQDQILSVCNVNP